MQLLGFHFFNGLHLLVIIEIDFLNNHEIVPIYLVLHGGIFLLGVSIRVLEFLELVRMRVIGLLLGLLFLVLVPKIPLTSCLQYQSRIFCKILQPFKLYRPYIDYLPVTLNQLSEVPEKTVCRFQEVKLRIPLLPLGQALQEFTTIPRDKLGSQLDDISVDIGQEGMMGD